MQFTMKVEILIQFFPPIFFGKSTHIHMYVFDYFINNNNSVQLRIKYYIKAKKQSLDLYVNFLHLGKWYGNSFINISWVQSKLFQGDIEHIRD